MVKPITTMSLCHTEPHYLVWPCDDKQLNNVAKEITTINMGRKKPTRPSQRCKDRLRSDLKEHQVDPKFVHPIISMHLFCNNFLTLQVVFMLQIIDLPTT